MTVSGRFRWMSNRRLALATASTATVLLLTVSCSGGDNGQEAGTIPDRASSTRPDETSTSRRASSTTSAAPTTPTVPPVSTAPPTSTPPSGGDPVSAAEQEVIDRYIAFWDARFAANTGTPNPADPALSEHATGAQLEAVVAETQANLDQGLAFRARSDPADFREVTIISVTGDQAVVQECFVDDGLVIERATGDVVNDTIATQSVRGELQRVDGEWRVSSSRLIQRWEGVAGCALAS